MRRSLLRFAAGVALMSATGGGAAAGGPQQALARATPSPAPPLRQLLDQYCVTCHNERVVRGRSSVPTPLVTQLRAAGLALDSLDLGTVGADAEQWEKVVRKLRTGAMPPDGRPRPDDVAVDGFVSWLETELDRAAAAAPDPGRQPAVRRLTRTEYRNAIRDLLGLDELPREMDLSVLLPPDNSASGFDNVAEVLFVSPTLLEGYLAAAQKISRLAVGDPTMPLLVNVHTLHHELPQDAWFEGLPFGTRGGTVIPTYLPLDGEYAVELELGGRIREPHQIEVSVDGERVHLFTVDQAAPTGDPLGSQYLAADRRLRVRIPVQAGPRRIGVTFLRKTSAPGEELRRPFSRGRGQQPSVASVTISGPHAVRGPGDTPSRRRIFVCHPSHTAQETPCATRILSTLARRAHRRAATDADVEMLLPFYHAGHGEGGFERGIQRALERLLVSPEFLFRIEREPADAGSNRVYRVSDVELASRLSFFLWSSIPDDELLDLAIAGRLQDPAVLDRQVRRMLAHPRSAALVSSFARQWLYLDDLEVKRPDDRLFPDFDKGLQQAMRRETELFVEHVFREDYSVLDLLRADFTFVNERLAKHYGLPHVYGDHFRRVVLPADSPRRGLLGHASILTLTAYATRTSPVLRGKWILENILSSPPPPPPPNVPALKDKSAEGKVLSMRERMVQHRANPVCASCHAVMDPLGFALENFDAVGRWRTHGESGAPVDVSASLPDGTTFEGVTGLRAVLLDQSETVASTVTEKLLTYALGRNLEHYDAPAVRAITRAAARSDYRFSSLVLGIVDSTPFRMRSSAR